MRRGTVFLARRLQPPGFVSRCDFSKPQKGHIFVGSRFFSESTEKKTEPNKGKESLGLIEKLKLEYKYANEFIAKKSGPERVRRRTVADIEITKKRWKTEDLTRHRAMRTSEEGKKRIEADLERMSEREKAEYEAKVRQEEEELEKLNATPLMKIDVEEETEWEKRLEAAKERFRRTAPIAKLRSLRRELIVSKNPMVSKIRDIKYDLEDNITDVKDFYETTQHPVVWRVRETVDKVTGETETGWAVGEIRRVDPGFEVNLFMEDLEEYMIPLVTEAFLRADMPVLQSVTEELAARVIFASARERTVQGHYWDTRTLNLDHLEFQGATVENEIPTITVSFVCQHVHCIKDKTGKIVEGSEAEIKNVFYLWKVVRTLDNPDFDWIITEFHTQRISSLAA